MAGIVLASKHDDGNRDGVKTRLWESCIGKITMRGIVLAVDCSGVYRA